MGDVWEGGKASERQCSVGKNKQVPVGTEAGGTKKAKATLLRVECNTSAWFQKTKPKKNTTKNPRGMPRYKGMD